MVSCLKCGQEIPPSEYSSHYASCVGGASWERLSPERISPEAWKDLREPGGSLDKLLQDMGRGCKAQDFDYFLRAGMEALVEIGVRIGLKNTREYTVRAKSGVYNNLAIAIISAHKGDWEEARRFLNKAIYELGLMDLV